LACGWIYRCDCNCDWNSVWHRAGASDYGSVHRLC
jgi:hypothetical protein